MDWYVCKSYISCTTILHNNKRVACRMNRRRHITNSLALFVFCFILLLRDTADPAHCATIVYVERETIAAWHIGHEHVMFEYDKVVVNTSFRRGTCILLYGVGLLAQKLDATLNETCRMITGCLKPTNTNSQPVLPESPHQTSGPVFMSVGITYDGHISKPGITELKVGSSENWYSRVR